jgi:DNA-binding MarR family transcriptional regulator/N-acetylglutamate synthase-like GNAT family acetyltransferase
MAGRAHHDPQHVAAVRRFNRFYTQHLGVLRHGWLDSPFSLTEARVLYELHQRGSATATEVGRELELDAGYLSRIVRRFEKDGLIQKKTSPSDARQNFLSLTAKGRAAYAPLESQTKRQISSVLGRLSAPEQDHLIASMRTIESMVTPEPNAAGNIVLRQPKTGDLGWVVTRHAELYAREYQWTDPFEGVCAQIVADFSNKFDPSCERGWIAEIDGQNVGCVFLVKDSATVARLRLLLVDPMARGRGLGTRLTDECIRFARECGYERITLWTHSILTAARHAYEKAGFRLTSSEKRKSFGQDVVSEYWDLVL